MAIIQFALSIIILGIIYFKMIKRETPSIGKAQAIVPVIFGVVSLVVSVALTVLIAIGLSKLGYNKNNISNLVMRSISSSFFAAGLSEEIAKCLFIVLCIKIFKPKNVYEYLLAGFGVGMGFTIFEEFLYGSSLVAVAIRILVITFHSVLGSIMASYIGKAIYYKLNKTENKNITMMYVKALLIPILIHTIYDATNVKNAGLENGVPENVQGIAVLIALVTMLFAFVLQIIIHVKIKKDTEKLIEMKVE